MGSAITTKDTGVTVTAKAKADGSDMMDESIRASGAMTGGKEKGYKYLTRTTLRELSTRVILLTVIRAGRAR